MNYTGRVFKCEGLEEKKAKYWSKYFTVGKKYKELQPTEEIDSMLTDKLLFLQDDQNHALIVQADQFSLLA